MKQNNIASKNGTIYYWICENLRENAYEMPLREIDNAAHNSNVDNYYNIFV